MGELGANAHGEILEAGRVPDCYLGLVTAADGTDEAVGLLVVAPGTLLHPCVPRPDGTVLYKLLTDHLDRMPGQLVFLADLTVELRAWSADTWAKVGIDPQAATRAVVAGWQRGDLAGRRLGGLTEGEALALERPAMTYVRDQLGDRLQRQLVRAYQRRLHPSSGRRPATGSSKQPPEGPVGIPPVVRVSCAARRRQQLRGCSLVEEGIDLADPEHLVPQLALLAGFGKGSLRCSI